MKTLQDYYNMENTRKQKIKKEIFDLTDMIRQYTAEASQFAVSPLVTARLRDINLAADEIKNLTRRLMD